VGLLVFRVYGFGGVFIFFFFFFFFFFFCSLGYMRVSSGFWAFGGLGYCVCVGSCGLAGCFCVYFLCT
jgi:hypothetical protein